MTNKEKAIVMAYTGVCMLSGDEFQYFHKYIEELMGRPVFTHELADGAICDKIKKKAQPDFLKLCQETETEKMTNKEHEMPEAVDKVRVDMDVIDLLRKLLTAIWDYNIAHRRHIGVMVEDVLNFLTDAMEEKLEKEEQEIEK